MILSDMRYLRIRSQLRDMMRDSRTNIPNLTALASEMEKSSEEKEQELFKRYLNPIDHERTKEFYDAVRKTKQSGYHCCLGLTRIPEGNRYIISQAEFYIKTMRRIRRSEK